MAWTVSALGPCPESPATIVHRLVFTDQPPGIRTALIISPFQPPQAENLSLSLSLQSIISQGT
jgi:hypothetical protein